MLSKLKLFFILCFFSSISANANDDSTGVVLRNGFVFKLHKVEKGQGLLTIARIYRVQWTDIRDANPGSEKGLKKDQTLLIPTKLTESQFFGSKIPVYSKNKSEYSKPIKPSVTEESKSPPPTSKSKGSFTTFYTVQKGETLYSIAQKFSTTVEFLMQLNKLKSAQLVVGKDLLVPISDPTANKTIVTKPENKTESIDSIKTSKPLAVDVEDSKDTIPFQSYSFKIENLPEYGIDKIVEKGLGKVTFDKKMNQEKDGVIHHNAPENSIIRITNPKNNKSTYVKVIKNFNRTEKDPVIIFLNKKTAEYLEVDKKGSFNIIISFAK